MKEENSENQFSSSDMVIACQKSGESFKWSGKQFTTADMVELLHTSVSHSISGAIIITIEAAAADYTRTLLLRIEFKRDINTGKWSRKLISGADRQERFYKCNIVNQAAFLLSVMRKASKIVITVEGTTIDLALTPLSTRLVSVKPKWSIFNIRALRLKRYLN